MTTGQQWLAKLVDRNDREGEGEVECEPYQGSLSPGDNGTHEKSFGTVYFAVEETKDQAEKRVKEVWDRRVQEGEA